MITTDAIAQLALEALAHILKDPDASRDQKLRAAATLLRYASAAARRDNQPDRAKPPRNDDAPPPDPEETLDLSSLDSQKRAIMRECLAQLTDGFLEHQYEHPRNPSEDPEPLPLPALEHAYAPSQ